MALRRTFFGSALAGLLACTLPAGTAQADTAHDMFEKGVAADDGPNGRSDPSLAYRYYQEAAEQGDADAELNLGLMNDSGVGTLADAGQAALWYARAAAHGQGRASFNLGQLYEAGEGVPQDRMLAAAWFARAAQEGIAAAGRRAARLQALAETSPSVAPVSPVPAAPAANATVRTMGAEFVWTPGRPPAGTSYSAGTSYWVEVRSDGPIPLPAALRPASVSALVVPLPRPGRYGWRVFAANPGLGLYQPSAWTDFTVAPLAVQGPDALTSR